MLLRIILLLMLLPTMACAEPELISSEVTPLKLSEARMCEAQLKYNEYQLIVQQMTADAYRVKLKELGWNCFPKGAEIHCITGEE